MAEALTLRDGRYAITRVLVEGAQTDTLEAVDKRDGRLVIIKRFRVKGAGSWKDVELAEREARVLTQLSHPSLPVYVDHFEAEGCLYLAMVKMEGDSLAALVSRGARFSEADIVRLLQMGADALEYLHAKRPPIIHRDIKPGNIIQRPDGSFGIVDFGSVRDSLKPEGGSTVVGTFGYMAPEQFQGRALPATDIYGLAATAVTLLTHKAPESLPHRGLAIDVPAALAGLASPALVEVLGRMLNPDPDQRPAALREFLSQGAVAGAATARAPERQPERPLEAPLAESGPESLSPFDGLLANPFILAATLTGLLAARVATWALFELFLATVFTVLSILVPPLRPVAGVFGQTGRDGRRALRQAAATVRQRADAGSARRHKRRRRLRVREDAHPHWRVHERPGDDRRQEHEDPRRAPRPGSRARRR